MTTARPSDETSRSSLVGDSAASAAWTLVSRATGFGRVILIGAVLGPTYFGNLFQLANQLPWIVFELAVGSLLYALLVPALVSSVASGDRAETERIAGGFLGLVIAGFTALTVVVMAASVLIAELFALPVTDPAVRDDFVRAAIPLVVLTGPQLVGYGIAMTGQAVQQAMGRFALPAAAGIAENLIVIGGLAVFALQYGTGLALADVGTEHLILLGGSATLGVFVHAAVQLWGVRRLGVSLRPRAGWTDPDITAILKKAVPSSGTAVLNSIRLLLLLVAANVVPGGVVAFQLALNVLNLPVALGAKPVAYASLPRLSLAHQGKDRASFIGAYRQGVTLAAAILLPAGAAAIAFGWSAGRVLAIGQMATPEGQRMVGLCLIGIGGSVIGEGLFQVATSGAYAMDDPVGPFRALVIRLGLTVLGLGIGFQIFDGPILLLTFALSMSVADLVGAVVLNRRIGRLLQVAVSSLARLRVVTLSMLAVFVPVGLVIAAVEWSGYAPERVATTLGTTTIAASAALGLFGLLVWRFDEQIGLIVTEYRHGPAVAVPAVAAPAGDVSITPERTDRQVAP